MKEQLQKIIKSELDYRIHPEKCCANCTYYVEVEPVALPNYTHKTQCTISGIGNIQVERHAVCSKHTRKVGGGL